MSEQVFTATDPDGDTLDVQHWAKAQKITVKVLDRDGDFQSVELDYGDAAELATAITGTLTEVAGA
ncbi:hypothetical protein AOT83_04840 [Mycobacteroides sp. H001]|uniref:hypothetical protein n=1 Tax=unclassified Mycobacteroides TaxID=2618759 RepID=UPI000716224F|nr:MULTISPECIES: hypothetical protein [unclassified Mycobacteroides]KRQ31325.1 hypothetical protein AOT86_01565 [Mycobacteroides sp. H072]KRQ35917.1 hypothetical protein AOT84_15545 [Mycobacteroides sp. H002]KRQ50544.1 hypothetical protein AOT85_13685 [Mycobacteroides sp. H054]KRQ72694.1 hypothetical protein AOT83_04840 [Mycobacteroides sp. H001]